MFSVENPIYLPRADVPQTDRERLLNGNDSEGSDDLPCLADHR